MAIPGVVGVTAGLLDGGGDDPTPCLRVLVVKRTRELRRRIPKQTEGHPVVLEESGGITAGGKQQN